MTARQRVELFKQVWEKDGRKSIYYKDDRALRPHVRFVNFDKLLDFIRSELDESHADRELYPTANDCNAKSWFDLSKYTQCWLRGAHEIFYVERKTCDYKVYAAEDAHKYSFKVTEKKVNVDGIPQTFYTYEF